MKKRFASLAVALVGVLTLTACGAKNIKGAENVSPEDLIKMNGSLERHNRLQSVAVGYENAHGYGCHNHA